MRCQRLLYNNLVLGGLFLSACLFMGLAATAADGDPIRVDFSGSLVGRPCNIAQNSLSQDVEFGNVPAKAFLNDGTTRPFFFGLNLTDCKPESGGVSVTFGSGANADANVQDAFALNGNGSVALRLAYQESEGQVVILTPGSVGPSHRIDATAVHLPFQASLVTADASKVNSGEFNLSLTATFEYD
ncbi:MAG TPA: fimbrial protein [Buttiauxella sp.]|jgi:type 1 fimbria pilin